LIFTATGLFGELQVALNRAWGVQPDSNQGGIRRFFVKRLFSLVLIVGMVLLLLVSMLLTTLLNEIYSYFQGAVPSGLSQFVNFCIDVAVTLLVATLLFAAVFKLLPDVEIQWRNLWVGAAATALLFVIGKGLIGWYLQRANLGSSWGGATASMIAVLAWLYYTSLIVLLGAEFTQVWTRNFGTGFEPQAGAQRTGKSQSGQ
jgi:membrane protein